MKILLIEPDYYTKYPPLGLLKIGKWEERNFPLNDVRLVNGNSFIKDFVPDRIYITSLFTYTWEKVHSAIDFYKSSFPDAELIVGGIYATLMPEHIHSKFPDVKIHLGLFEDSENLLPAYYLLKQVAKWNGWNKSIVFTSRGCIRKCPFCVVPETEGDFKANKASIKYFIHPGHKEVVIWDNNFLASPYSKNILKELAEYKIMPDFNQGLDVRLVDEETAFLLAGLKPKRIHFAYDFKEESYAVERAIHFLEKAGFNKRNLIFYMLYNFYNSSNGMGDTPEDFFYRLIDLMKWGVTAYPMKYVPLDALDKNKFISPLWNAEKLEMVAMARRVLGYGGAFVPYTGFVNKINNSNCFEEAMELRPMKIEKKHEEITNTYNKSAALMV
ncbi:MAG: radical SAM protein [bacterium]|jgi:hypothetical protein